MQKKIEGLLDNNDIWVEDKEGIKEIARGYFHNLFADDTALGIPSGWPKLFPNINTKVLDNLNDKVST